MIPPPPCLHVRQTLSPIPIFSEDFGITWLTSHLLRFWGLQCSTLKWSFTCNISERPCFFLVYFNMHPHTEANLWGSFLGPLAQQCTLPGQQRWSKVSQVASLDQLWHHDSVRLMNTRVFDPHAWCRSNIPGLLQYTVSVNQRREIAGI